MNLVHKDTDVSLLLPLCWDFLQEYAQICSWIPSVEKSYWLQFKQRQREHGGPYEGLNCIWTFLFSVLSFFKIFFLKHNIDWESSFLLIFYCAINFVFIRSVLRKITKEIFDFIRWHFYLYSHYASLPWSNTIIITWIKDCRRI